MWLKLILCDKGKMERQQNCGFCNQRIETRWLPNAAQIKPSSLCNTLSGCFCGWRSWDFVLTKWWLNDGSLHQNKSSCVQKLSIVSLFHFNQRLRIKNEKQPNEFICLRHSIYLLLHKVPRTFCNISPHKTNVLAKTCISFLSTRLVHFSALMFAWWFHPKFLSF